MNYKYMVRFNTDCYFDGTPTYMFRYIPEMGPLKKIVKAGTIGYIQEGVYYRDKGVALGNGPIIVKAYTSFLDFRRNQVEERRITHQHGVSAWLIVGDTEEHRDTLWEAFKKQNKLYAKKR